ncbi:glycosyltransferase family 39 protein [Zavarzinia compransoris]|uniref:ArnT family glycosyltransferase n=1 Tax=Zavarzinia marina TaxID=2911065 RepID=UPI001F388835|nr:glycosyltransferase family 39 protein [Zavarzinia marina]MCF4164451.1 glycosyltransferase family 39 protein [Zavarzinia marina]
MDKSPPPSGHSAPAAGTTADRDALRLVVTVALGIAVLRLVALAIGQMPLYLDEAQYWFWGQDLAFGYFSKPPLIGWAIAATTAVCGDGPACVKAPSVLAYGIAPIFVYLLARNLFGTRVGVLAAIGFATLPGVAFSGFIISTDPLLLMCWCGALWTFERASATGERRFWLATGLFLGIGMMAKYAMIYFAVPALIVTALGLVGKRRQWGGLALAGVVGLLILSPNLIWNALTGFETFRHTAANASVGAHIGNIGGVVDFLGDQVAILGPVLAVALVVLLVWPRGIFRDPGIRLLAWFSLPILALLVVQAFLSRAHGNWAAVAFPALAVLIFAALARLDYRRLIKGTLIFHGVLFLILGVGLAVGQVPFVELSTRTDPFRWIRGWDRLATAVDALRLDADGERPRAVITTERGATAELIYHLRDGDALIRRWQADDTVPDDHFAMVLDLDDALGCDAVIVSRGDSLPPDLVARFDAVTGPTRVDMRPYPDRKGTYYLFVGGNFGRERGTTNACRSITRTGRPL